MGFFECVKMAFTSIGANKMRAFLTMLGIIIGISAVITITTIGNSIQQTLTRTINELGGANIFDIEVTFRDDLSDEDWEEYFNGNISMTDEDYITDDMISELQQRYPDCFEMIHNEILGGAEVINYNNDYLKTIVMGVSDGYISSFKIKFLEGRDITLNDIDGQKHSIIVSDVFVRQYFKDDEEPLGKTITYTMSSGENQEFTIVGVYENSAKIAGPEDPSLSEIEKTTYAFIPLSTVYKLNGVTDGKYTYLSLQWNPEKDPKVMAEYLEEFFNEKFEHNKYWNVMILDENEILKMFNTVINMVTIAISVIAAISLIVGGVGVMNIMLVSITERTREIGIRKALGAKNSSIRIQFVIEAIIICLIGGIIGIIVGISNGMLIGTIAKSIVNTSFTEYAELFSITVQPSFTAILISVLFSMLTGVFFGYYPANKAAKMNPIDALRYD